jgi:mevalonate kinase
MNKIKISTPGKLMVFGEHAVVHGWPCIVAAVDRRFVVEVERLDRPEIVVEAPGVGLKYYRKSLQDLGTKRVPKEVLFVETVVKNFFKQHKNGGLKIKTKNHFSSEFGFGSSAAVTVGLAKALHELFRLRISNQQLFDFCYQVVLEVQGLGSGFDIAAALYGGVLYFLTGGKMIKSLSVKNLPVVVGYTGVKADTPTLVRQVAELQRHHPIKVERIFKAIGRIVKQGEKTLLAGDWPEAGRLMNQDQELLDELGVSSLELDRLIEAARGAGAYGAKLSGAGGGDCMIALVGPSQRKEVEKAITKAGGEVLKVSLGAFGVRREK